MSKYFCARTACFLVAALFFLLTGAAAFSQENPNNTAPAPRPPEAGPALIRMEERLESLRENVRADRESARAALDAMRQTNTETLRQTQAQFQHENALLRGQYEKDLRQLQDQIKSSGDSISKEWQAQKDALSKHEKIVDWGLNLAGILVAIFGIIAPIAVFVMAGITRRESKKLMKETEEELKKKLGKAEKLIHEIEENKEESAEKIKESDKGKMEKVIDNPATSVKDKAFAEAYRLQAENKLDAAIEKWRDNIDKLALKKEDISRAYFNIGYLLQSKEKWDDAIKNYSMSIELDNSGSVAALCNRGVAHARRGKDDDFDRALADYSKVLEINPNNVKVLCNRGTAYTEHGKGDDFDLALADYNKAWDLDTGSIDVYVNYLELLLVSDNLGKFSELRRQEPSGTWPHERRIIAQMLYAVYSVISGKDESEELKKLDETLKTPKKLDHSFKVLESWLAKPDNKLDPEKKNRILELINKVKAVCQ
jgi:tetratricopeptide (TPR) repeat protein